MTVEDRITDYPEDLSDERTPVVFEFDDDDRGNRHATVAEHEAVAILEYWRARGHAVGLSFPDGMPYSWEGHHDVEAPDPDDVDGDEDGDE